MSVWFCVLCQQYFTNRAACNCPPTTTAQQETASMNTPPRRNTSGEMLEVIAAHAAGKTIETRLCGPHARGSWSVTNAPRFNFGERQYRIQPDPLKGFVVVNERGNFIGGSRVRASAERIASRRPGLRVVPVQEVAS